MCEGRRSRLLRIEVVERDKGTIRIEESLLLARLLRPVISLLDHCRLYRGALAVPEVLLRLTWDLGRASKGQDASKQC